MRKEIREIWYNKDGDGSDKKQIHFVTTNGQLIYESSEEARTTSKTGLKYLLSCQPETPSFYYQMVDKTGNYVDITLPETNKMNGLNIIQPSTPIKLSTNNSLTIPNNKWYPDGRPAISDGEPQGPAIFSGYPGHLILDTNACDVLPDIANTFEYGKITSLTLNEGLTKISGSHLYNCTYLTIINYNCTQQFDFSANNNIFDQNLGSSQTTAINIGPNVTHIPTYFMYPSKAIDDGTPNLSLNIKVFDNNNKELNIGDYAFRHCKISELSLPARVSDIGDYAFASIDGLTKISFSGPVMLRTGCFSQNSDLNEIKFYNDVQIDSNVFKRIGNKPDASNGKVIKFYFGGELIAKEGKKHCFFDEDYPSQRLQAQEWHFYNDAPEKGERYGPHALAARERFANYLNFTIQGEPALTIYSHSESLT